MLKKLLIAASLLTSTSVFAASTTVTFSGRDLFGPDDTQTAKINISSAVDFDLTGILDPSFRFLEDNNSGLYQGLTLISDSNSTFTYAPVILPLRDFDVTRYTFSVSNLAAGNYTLQFNLFGGGRYEGSYTISPIAVPVPEPESYGMIFTGLALMGYVLRRQKSNSTQKSA